MFNMKVMPQYHYTPLRSSHPPPPRKHSSPFMLTWVDDNVIDSHQLCVQDLAFVVIQIPLPKGHLREQAGFNTRKKDVGRDMHATGRL